jgi:hypothetical protein
MTDTDRERVRRLLGNKSASGCVVYFIDSGANPDREANQTTADEVYRFANNVLAPFVATIAPVD